MKASVRVMRSYDYCHFEVALDDEVATLNEVNDLRKQAAILVDEAVRQYVIAKTKESDRQGNQWKMEQALHELELAKQKPLEELTPQQAALLRMDADKEFWKQYESDDYYYQDMPERDYHFSMLRKFQNATIKAG